MSHGADTVDWHRYPHPFTHWPDPLQTFHAQIILLLVVVIFTRAKGGGGDKDSIYATQGSMNVRPRDPQARLRGI